MDKCYVIEASVGEYDISRWTVIVTCSYDSAVKIVEEYKMLAELARIDSENMFENAKKETNKAFGRHVFDTTSFRSIEECNFYNNIIDKKKAEILTQYGKYEKDFSALTDKSLCVSFEEYELVD